MVEDNSKRRFPDRGLTGVRYVDFVPPFDIENTRAVLDQYGSMYIVAPWGVGKTSLSYWLNGPDEREYNTVILDLITVGLHRANKISNKILKNIYMYVQSEVNTNADWDTFVPAPNGAPLFNQFYAAFSPALECERIKTIVLDEVRMMEDFISNDQIEFYDVMVKLCSENGKKLIIISQAPVWQISDNAQRVRGLSDEKYLQNIFDDRTTIAPIPLPYYFFTPSPLPKERYAEDSAAMKEGRRLPPEIIEDVYRLFGYHSRDVNGTIVDIINQPAEFMTKINELLPQGQREEYSDNNQFCNFLMLHRNELQHVLLNRIPKTPTEFFRNDFEVWRSLYRYNDILNMPQSSNTLRIFTNIFCAAIQGCGVEIPREGMPVMARHLVIPGWVRYKDDGETVTYRMSPALRAGVQAQDWYPAFAQKHGIPMAPSPSSASGGRLEFGI